MEILAVIPARGGSKGVLNKNLQEINGISLVGIAAKNALETNCFTKVHVSTDSDLIREEALKYNADCSYLRPSELARDSSKTNDAINFCLLKERDLGNEYDAICELQPTYVFRGKTIIKNSVSKFIELEDNFNSLLTLEAIKSTAHPDYACKIKENKEVIYGNEDPNNFNRQEISDYFRFHGMVIISKTKYFLENKSLFNKPTFGFEIYNQRQQYDINDERDLEIARIIAKNYPNILFL